jgi:hypothetical protein
MQQKSLLKEINKKRTGKLKTMLPEMKKLKVQNIIHEAQWLSELNS